MHTVQSTPCGLFIRRFICFMYAFLEFCLIIYLLSLSLNFLCFFCLCMFYSFVLRLPFSLHICDNGFYANTPKLLTLGYSTLVEG